MGRIAYSILRVPQIETPGGERSFTNEVEVMVILHDTFLSVKIHRARAVDIAIGIVIDLDLSRIAHIKHRRVNINGLSKNGSRNKKSKGCNEGFHGTPFLIFYLY